MQHALYSFGNCKAFQCNALRIPTQLTPRQKVLPCFEPGPRLSANSLLSLCFEVTYDPSPVLGGQIGFVWRAGPPAPGADLTQPSDGRLERRLSGLSRMSSFAFPGLGRAKLALFGALGPRWAAKRRPGGLRISRRLAKSSPQAARLPAGPEPIRPRPGLRRTASNGMCPCSTMTCCCLPPIVPPVY